MPKFRVLVAHNHYQLAGGEDAVFRSEVDLLRRHGHDVETYSIHNDAVSGQGRLGLAAGTVWNKRSYEAIAELVRDFKAQIVHFHNTLPLISPSGYYAARDNGAAVVQTLHNYRLACINGLFFREGRVCEDCLGKGFGWPGVAHKCYRASRSASLTVAGMVWWHRKKGTWANAVDRYIALTEFGRDKMLQAGLPAGKVVVKPNFLLQDEGIGTHEGGFALFVGRLSEEKGIAVLVDAWSRVESPLPLRIVGDGPLAEVVRQAQEVNPAVSWLGARPAEEVRQLMRDASFLVVPSTWQEPFGLVAIEAFSSGLPVLASDVGALRSLVRAGDLGMRFKPSNPSALADCVRWAYESPQELARMSPLCRQEYEAKFTPASNIRQLERIYEEAVQAREAC